MNKTFLTKSKWFPSYILILHTLAPSLSDGCIDGDRRYSMKVPVRDGGDESGIGKESVMEDKIKSREENEVAPRFSRVLFWLLGPFFLWIRLSLIQNRHEPARQSRMRQFASRCLTPCALKAAPPTPSCFTNLSPPKEQFEQIRTLLASK